MILPDDVMPFARDAAADAEPQWTGVEVDLRNERGETVAQDRVIFLQDGLRFFVNGHPDQPVPDVVLGDDPEDSGQRGINYRSAPVHRGRAPRTDTGVAVLHADEGLPVWLRVVGACEKPRNHSFTVHGGAWEKAPWLKGRGPWVGGVSGATANWVEDIVLSNLNVGDHAMRTGQFRWGTELGMWAILRVGPRRHSSLTTIGAGVVGA